MEHDPRQAVIWSAARGLARRLGVEPAFCARFPEANAAPLTDAPPELPDPDALGALLEALGEPARDAAFTELLGNAARHGGTSALATTQRFTPAWIADWLVEAVLAGAASPTRCLDPACGGGQLLLALYRGLRGRGAAPQTLLREVLVGCDADPLAAAVCAAALWLEAAAEAPAAELPRPRCYAVAGTPELELLGSLAGWEALAAATGGALAPGAFEVVIANPPYMGARHMSAALRGGLANAYGAFRGDLYTAFLRRCVDLTAPAGRLAVLCQASFLFLGRDRPLRQHLLAEIAIERMLHLGARAFASMDGEKASVVAWSARRAEAPDDHAVEVIDLQDLRSPEEKRAAFDALEAGDPAAGWRRRTTAQAWARARRGASFAHWWPDRLAHLLDLPDHLGDAAEIPGCPHKTAANGRFVRCWWEVPDAHIGMDAPEDVRWLRYAKGGGFRRWSGNLERVVDWSTAARDFYRTHPTSSQLAEVWWGREGLTWSDLGSRSFSLRHLPPGCVFDMAGPAIFPGPALPLTFWLAFLNAPLVCQLLNADNPTIHYQISNLRGLPLPALHADDPDVLTLARLGAEALALGQARDAWELTSPPPHAPLLLEVASPGASLRDTLRAAADRFAALHAQLAALEAAAAACVERLYGVTSGDDLPALRIPPTPSPLRARLLEDALLCGLQLPSGAAEAQLGALAWGELLAALAPRGLRAFRRDGYEALWRARFPPSAGAPALLKAPRLF